MLGSLLYAIFRFAFDLLIVRRGSEADLRAEVLALRHHSVCSSAYVPPAMTSGRADDVAARVGT
jgi:hypothetical protein